MALDATSDESDTWARARTGDRSAFGEIFDRHFDRVYRHALGILGHVHDAEDAAALVFLEAWRKRATVRVVDGTVRPWLLVTTTYVCSNTARAHRRHRIAMAKLPLDDRIEDPSEGVLTAIEISGQYVRLREAFAHLSSNDQKVLTLCVVNDYSLQAAADTLAVPLGTVKSRLARAKKRLAALTGPRSLDDTTPALGELK
ncbi:ECF RNA polymerase sigma factor SigE [Frondihabitans sp. 762G35]|uniref:RNA polymerase sigma factor n=1 Tax=Frondihabitans sp. 762G35 TaxID=1446794 RepID=UPI000D21518A|nr:RNA polymerase sigma factor [Frondihabitans sp. 762G35]ARC57602.1 ECF RNA polymerase sigma factor SigE [Frondihabitans sp. 762G35]